MKSFSKLRMRLTLICAISTGLVLVGVSVSSYLTSAQLLMEQYSERFSRNCTSIYAHLQEKSAISHAWMKRIESQNDIILNIQSETGQMLYASQDELRKALTKATSGEAKAIYGFDGAKPYYITNESNVLNFEMSYNLNQYRSSVAVISAGTNWITVTIIKNMESELEKINLMKMQCLLRVILSLISLTGFAWFFSGWAARPLVENQKRQISFIAAASHEFRSPVSVIQMGVENLKDAPPELAAHFMDIVLRECGRLGRLTEDVLKIASADNRSLSLCCEMVNPETIMRSIYETYVEVAHDKDINIELSLPSQPLPMLRCDFGRMEQALNIIMDNAIRYVPPKGIIRMCGVIQSKKMVFSISDSGPGISDQEKMRIFERFYRGDNARTDKEHYGLGLSIAKELITLQSGNLFVKNSQCGGAEFVIEMHM